MAKNTSLGHFCSCYPFFIFAGEGMWGTSFHIVSLFYITTVHLSFLNFVDKVMDFKGDQSKIKMPNYIHLQ